MEVGAVKQAFNNEVILLKKKLTQAKIQVIHKLTRKSKQLIEKKAPDSIKEKFKRKAESAVNEVLIIKKIKPKDLAKFIVTHKGELKAFLNKPTVDNDKACARLLLHKALQDKYKFIRDRFSDVPIQDLFMSRLERRKMKKEAKEKQKNKKKRKDNKVISSEGDWDVENVDGKDKIKLNNNDNGQVDDTDIDATNSDRDESHSDNDEPLSGNDEPLSDRGLSDSDSDDNGSGEDDITHQETENVPLIDDSEGLNDSESDGPDSKSQKQRKPSIPFKSTKMKTFTKSSKTIDADIKTKVMTKANKEKKQKDANKNRNFNEKILQRKLKKDLDTPVVDNKIVDPFFITSTGENYMSVVEPRGPDEVKDEHKQGNRKLRRALMFGHNPKPKLRQDNNNYRNNNRFNSKNEYQKEDNFRGKFNNKEEFSDRKSFNNNFDDRKRFNAENEKPEKLHPSWEAKKKKSGILPFEGKKIVFD